MVSEHQEFSLGVCFCNSVSLEVTFKMLGGGGCTHLKVGQRLEDLQRWLTHMAGRLLLATGGRSDFHFV